MRIIALVCLPLLLSGCALFGEPKPAPGFITDEPQFVLPGECFIPPAAEPKLPEDRDTEVDVATRDREALKMAFRAERAKRSACGERLKTLFPEGAARARAG